MKLSFVIPCYRSESTIGKVVEEIVGVVATDKYEYEIILVNDCSPDNVWDVIKEIAKSNDKVKGVCLARNFGQHNALMAGYREASGDYIISLDDDGQTPIDEFEKLMIEFNKGYDVVYAYYQEHTKFYRELGTLFADKMAEQLIGMPKGNRGSSFFAMKKFVKDEMITYSNAYPYLAGLVYRTTKNVSCIPLSRRSRIDGESGYSLKKLIKLWFNGFSAFSAKPLEFSVYVGMVFSLLGFIAGVIVVIRKIVGATTVEGWTTLVSLNLIIGGLILMVLGLIGEYIGRIYISINNAPQYVVKEKINVD